MVNKEVLSYPRKTDKGAGDIRDMKCSEINKQVKKVILAAQKNIAWKCGRSISLGSQKTASYVNISRQKMVAGLDLKDISFFLKKSTVWR